MTPPRSDEMLALSVHSMPVPGRAGLAQSAMTSRMKLLALLVVCSLPVIAAWLAFSVVRPQGRAGYGELIQPVRPSPDQAVTTLDGVAYPLASLKGQWLLAMAAGGACPRECQRQLYLLRQFRLTLGKDKDRVDWVWLVSDSAPVDPFLARSLRQDGATVLRANSATLADWLSDPHGKNLQDFVFVIDPMGNAMMRFPAGFDAQGAARARRDMERLLRASLSWDSPGR